MEIQCPFCGEPTEVEVDLHGDDDSGSGAAGNAQTFVQDCDVCCRPISVRARLSADGEVEADFERE